MDTFVEMIKAGNADGVRALLDRNPEVLDTECGEAPSHILLAKYHGKDAVADVIRRYRPTLTLWEAAAVGDRHALGSLLAARPSAHSEISGDGFSALGYAAFFGHREVLQDLLRAGADPNVASRNGLAVMPLHSALAGQHKEMARILIEHGADVNAVSGAGWTPLHYTAEHNDIETARLLLDHHAKRDVKNSDGKAAWQMAEERGFSDLAEILRPVGA